MDKKKIAIGAAGVAGVGALGYVGYKLFGGHAKVRGKQKDSASAPADATTAAALPAGPDADSAPDTDTSPVVQVEELTAPDHYRIHLRSGHVREVVRRVRPRIHERFPLFEEVIEDGQEFFGIHHHERPAVDIFGGRHVDDRERREHESRERGERERLERERKERGERR